MPGVTPEMIDEAKKMDLLTYLMNYDRGELVKESANTYSTRTHDSLKISNGKWMWFSRGFGGYTALDYLIKVEGCSFIEAVQKITGQVANTSPVFSYPKNTKKANKLLLPKANENNDRVIKYLLGRGIDKEVVLECISEGLIFESEAPYHNAMFVGFDEEHIPRHAAYRATNGSRLMGDATGSSKAYSFHIVRNENIVLNVFESAIDLLSYITFRKI